jgi:hypothetical protein
MTAAVPSGSVRPQGFMAPSPGTFSARTVRQLKKTEKTPEQGPQSASGWVSTDLGKAGANRDEPTAITVAWRQ